MSVSSRSLRGGLVRRLCPSQARLRAASSVWTPVSSVGWITGANRVWLVGARKACLPAWLAVHVWSGHRRSKTRPARPLGPNEPKSSLATGGCPRPARRRRRLKRFARGSGIGVVSNQLIVVKRVISGVWRAGCLRLGLDDPLDASSTCLRTSSSMAHVQLMTASSGSRFPSALQAPRDHRRFGGSHLARDDRLQTHHRRRRHNNGSMLASASSLRASTTFDRAIRGRGDHTRTVPMLPKKALRAGRG